MKVSELTGAQLDYWVAKAQGFGGQIIKSHSPCNADYFELTSGVPFRPSTHWAHGGPIVDRERMSFATMGTGPAGEGGKAPIVAIPENGRRAMEGATHLIAAMRAYVALKFGDEVPEVELSQDVLDSIAQPKKQA